MSGRWIGRKFFKDDVAHALPTQQFGRTQENLFLMAFDIDFQNTKHRGRREEFIER
jgi:hypothetical protein